MTRTRLGHESDAKSSDSDSGLLHAQRRAVADSGPGAARTRPAPPVTEKTMPWREHGNTIPWRIRDARAPIGLVVDHEDGGACGDTPTDPFHIVSLGRGRARVALWHEEIRRLA